MSSKTITKFRDRRRVRPDKPDTIVDLSPWKHMLGTVPDSTIAKLSGLSRSRVQARRVEQGIAPLRQERRYSAKDDELIASNVARTEIAKKLGVTARAVTLRRQWLKNGVRK